MAKVVEAQTTRQMQENKVTTVVTSNSDMLQQLVTEAVKKVLADQEVDTEKFSKNISQVVEELTPTLASGSTASICNTTPNIVGTHIAIPTPITRPVACVYNPTPIAELKKRHIPVISYMPSRESKVAVKRKPSPEKAKPWLNIVQESSNCEVEVIYKPTAIVNTTDKDTVQSYVPTIKSDFYDDSNSNDYQSKFKEAYYPKSKKKREEYVPKKIKAPLKTTQQLDDTIIDQFEPEFDMMDEILTANHIAPKVSGSAKASPNENSQDYTLDIESKFSDDEFIEDISKDEESLNIKKIEKIANMEEKEKENLQCIKIDVDKQKSNKDDRIQSNHFNAKMGDTKNSNKFKQHKRSDVSKPREKREDKDKKHTDKEKEIHRNRENKEKNKSHSSKKKERSGHKSDSRNKHHSLSSSRDKDRKRSTYDSKASLHKNREHKEEKKEYIGSQKDRHTSSKKNRHDHYKFNQHDKHKSRTNSKSSKHARKSDKKHCLESNQRTNSLSGKFIKHKENNSERNLSDKSDNPANTYPFINDEILELSDSDHDVQEECLKIFQVNNLHIYNIIHEFMHVYLKFDCFMLLLMSIIFNFSL